MHAGDGEGMSVYRIHDSELLTVTEFIDSSNNSSNQTNELRNAHKTV